VRGRTVAAALLDEIAFWESPDCANPAGDVIGAIRPAMATIPNSLMILMTTPWGRFGPAWELYRDHYGRDDSSMIVWRAPSILMNPTLSRTKLALERVRDPVKYVTEYEVEFRSDITRPFEESVIVKCTRPGPLDLPFARDQPDGAPIDRRFFVDTAGGEHDAYTLAEAHRVGSRIVIGFVKGWRAPFDPKIVTREACAVLKSYGANVVTGDRFANQWPVKEFAQHGVTLLESKLTKSQIFSEAIALFMSEVVEIPDHPILQREIRMLERRVGRTRDVIDHPHAGSDDYVNSALGAAVLVATNTPVGEGVMIAELIAGSFFDNYAFPEEDPRWKRNDWDHV
jgi:hypothetical protein